MSVINTNISSIQAQNSLRLTQLNQSQAMERLSSGVRINSAKDDAAGLAISTRMTANIRGIAAAVRNANDGISLTQTAEGSLGQISDNLQRIRELAVQSANTGNNASDRAAMNNEAAQLILEIDRVASNSAFNGINLLDGTFKNQALQVGAGNTANDRLVISIGSAKSSALGVGANSSFSASKVGTATVTATALAAGDLSINGYQVGASVSDGVSFANASASGIAKAAAINAISGRTGVTATVAATTKVGAAATTATTATIAGDLLINGVDIGAMAASSTAVDRGVQTAAAVNSKSTQTGVTATFDATSGAVTLNAADGRNITITGRANGMTGTGLGNLSPIASVATTTAGSAVTGSEATEVATVTVARNLTAGETLTVGGLTFTSTGASTIAQVAAAFANLSNGATTGDATYGTFSGTLSGWSTGAGNGTTTIVATSATADTDVTDLAISTGTGNYTSTISLSTTSSAGIILGGTSGLQAVNQTVTAATATASAGAGVSSLDLTTATGSQNALATLDSAINTITDSRAAMGAYQNRLSASISNLETTSQNLQASRSRIMDTDYAKESTNLAKSQIISQAATAMLAQANQSQQSVLALLK